jgi:hypothetical protein
VTSGKIEETVMNGNGLSLLEAVSCGCAALLMVLAGMQKKLLRRKDTQPRCRTCGRADRYNCACRR